MKDFGLSQAIVKADFSDEHCLQYIYILSSKLCRNLILFIN